MDKKNDIIKALIEYEGIAAELQRNISMTRLQVNSDIDAEDTMLHFARTNEDLYLKMKKFTYDVLGRNSDNIMEEFGTTDSFPSTLEEIQDGVWKFTLPPFFSIQNKKRFSNEGRHMYYLVMNLENEYEKTHQRIEKMAKPVVIFRHHICTEKDYIFDYDNVDSKRAIDAMQGFFLERDDALYLTTVHSALKDTQKSYCEIFVFDSAKTEFEDEGISVKASAR